jgi:hypothetical protein
MKSLSSISVDLGEDPDYDIVIARYKQMKCDWKIGMKVVPGISSR